METALGILGVIVILAGILPLLAWGTGRILRKIWMHFAKRAQRGNQTIITEYTAPAGVRPAELAYLYDRTFGEEELLATVFDLEQRKKIALHPVDDATNFSITLQAEVQDSNVAAYESDIMLAIQQLGSSADWHALRQSHVLTDSYFELSLEKSLQTKGLFAPKGMSEVTHRILLAAAVVMSFAVLFFPVLPFDTPKIADLFSAKPSESSLILADNGYVKLDRQITYFFVSVLCAITAAILYCSLRISRLVYARAMNMERGTKKLQKLWPAIEGYRIFIEQVELNQVTFSNQTDKIHAQHQALPYAVALNLTTDWQDRFK